MGSVGRTVGRLTDRRAQLLSDCDIGSDNDREQDHCDGHCNHNSNDNAE